MKKRLIVLTLMLTLLLAGVAQATSLVLATVERTSLATALNTDIGGGTIKIYSGSSPGPNSGASGTLLSTHTIPAAGGNTVASGVITLGTMTDATAAGSNTAGYARIATSGGAVICDVDVGTASATIILNTTTIVSGGPVHITSATLTVPPGS